MHRSSTEMSVSSAMSSGRETEGLEAGRGVDVRFECGWDGCGADVVEVAWRAECSFAEYALMGEVSYGGNGVWRGNGGTHAWMRRVLPRARREEGRRVMLVVVWCGDVDRMMCNFLGCRIASVLTSCGFRGHELHNPLWAAPCGCH